MKTTSSRSRAIAVNRPNRFAQFVAISVLSVGTLIACVGALRADDNVIVAQTFTTLGSPKYPADFAHFDYVNPDAPKGGEISFAAVGTFNSLMPFSRKGDPASLSSVMVERFMETSLDDPNTDYGLLAERLEYPESQDWVIFHIRPEARFSDGEPVTADDAVFTWNLLIEQAFPSYRDALARMVSSVEKVGPLSVKYTFNPEVPREGLISQMGTNAVLPQHYFEAENLRIDESTMTPILGSGPYMFESADAPRQVTYVRNPDYWGNDLPLNKGRHNFDRIRIEYFGDAAAAFEGFKSGAFSFRQETSSKNWGTSYDFPALDKNWVVKKELPNTALPTSSGFVFNLGKDAFQDKRVRQAIALMYNFTWTNETLQYGLFAQRESFWQNTDMAARGLPEGRELEVLQSLGDLIDPSLLTTPAVLPHTSSERQLDRRNLRAASKLMEEAGYVVDDSGMLVKDGERLSLTLLEGNPSFDRIMLPFIENLKRLGVDANYERVDPAQFTARRRDRDYDMIYGSYATGYGPGLGYTQRFGSEDAAVSLFNPAGFANEAADAIMEKMLISKTQEEFVATARALDRVMRDELFIIPTWYNDKHWVAYYDMFEHPPEDILPPLALGHLDFWWFNAERAAELEAVGAFQN